MSIRKFFKDLDDDLNLSDNAKEFVSGTSQFLTGGLYDVTGRPGYLVKPFLDSAPPEAATVVPGVPTLSAARAAYDAEAEVRRRRGRAAAILSERPLNPLGYTGGGYIASSVLGGSQ